MLMAGAMHEWAQPHFSLRAFSTSSWMAACMPLTASSPRPARTMAWKSATGALVPTCGQIGNRVAIPLRHVAINDWQARVRLT